MKNPIVQVQLVSGTTHRVCYVPHRKDLRVGTVITLKDGEDDTRLWTVQSKGEPVEQSSVLSDWKVGGL